MSTNSPRADRPRSAAAVATSESSEIGKSSASESSEIGKSPAPAGVERSASPAGPKRVRPARAGSLDRNPCSRSPTSEKRPDLLAMAKIGDEFGLFALLDTQKDGLVVDMEEVDSKGCTALMLATEAGHFDTCEMLLNKGKCNVDTINEKTGRTALHIAINKGKLPIAKLLAEKYKAQLEIPDITFGYTPLLHAISIGDHQSLLWLIHRGANVDVRDRDTLSALHVASDGGHLEAAKILIGQGADPTCTTKKGQTPIDIARTEEMKEYLLGQLQNTKIHKISEKEADIEEDEEEEDKDKFGF